MARTASRCFSTSLCMLDTRTVVSTFRAVVTRGCHTVTVERRFPVRDNRGEEARNGMGPLSIESVTASSHER